MAVVERWERRRPRRHGSKSRRGRRRSREFPVLILYTTEDGKSQIKLRADQQTVWLTQLECT
jgi:hypothetical protein